MKKIYDIAIVGAGPGGSFFAREVSRLCPELRVVMIDGQNEKNKKPCGGLLSPDAQKLLAEYELTLPNSVLADPQIFKVDTIDLVTGRVKYYQRSYLNMDRYAFDKWLISLVPDCVDILSDRVKSIKRAEDGWLLTLGGGEIKVKTVVGADGSNSLVRRTLGKKSPKQYVAIQEWYENTDEKIPYYSCIFDRKTSDSCSWTIHKDEHTIFGGAFEKNGCREAFDEQKARLEAFIGCEFGEPLFREACLVSSPRNPRDFFSGIPSVYLIGEAAGFISASSYEGISNAVSSAKSLALAFAEGKTHAEILRKYKKNTIKQRIKLTNRMIKRAILCSQPLRSLIMQSGVQSLDMAEK